MTLQERRYERGVARNRLVDCPFCGKDFEENEHRWKHFLDDHDVEDVPALAEGDGRPGTGFQTATEFYGLSELEEPVENGETRNAKGIVWYDQETPLYVCEGHETAVRPLRWSGSRETEDYDERRAAAYRSLLEGGKRCDVCTGRLREKVDR